MIVLSLLAAVVIYISARQGHDSIRRKLLMEYPGKFITIAILLLINLLSRLSRIEVLSMRFITYILLIWMVYSFYSIYRDLKVVYPQKISLQKSKVVKLEEKFKIHKNKGPKKTKKQR
jgi:hypothetical protein